MGSVVTYDHIAKVNDTLDVVHDEQQYLAMNMTSLGTLLDSFISTFLTSTRNRKCRGSSEPLLILGVLDEARIFKGSARNYERPVIHILNAW